MDRWERSERVRAFAHEAGFEMVGITALGSASTTSAYRRWLERGDQAGMAWMERNTRLRADPRALLSGARSAVVVGLRYAPLDRRLEEDGRASDLWPRVARYAWGRDYHSLLRERLGEVAEAIEGCFPGVQWRICVDTAPLLERELAAHAGLGAIGKNTNLIHPRFGSWFLLGEMLLDLDLQPDVPLSDLCGECSACLEACPTDALREPYRLDARRCLSYWTIEHRGSIPEAFRGELADRVFGCDICQEVCPWNSDPPPVEDPEMAVPARRAGLSLVDLVRMNQATFVASFRDSALKRAKLEGLRRNAALALAASSDEGARAALAECGPAEISPIVREAVEWALSVDPTAKPRIDSKP